MSSTDQYLEFVLDLLGELDDVAHRKMMGEYVLYYRGKVVGGIYDDRFLLKIMPASEQLLPGALRVTPYEGAREMLLVELEDRDTLHDDRRGVGGTARTEEKEEEVGARPRIHLSGLVQRRGGSDLVHRRGRSRVSRLAWQQGSGCSEGGDELRQALRVLARTLDHVGACLRIRTIRVGNAVQRQNTRILQTRQGVRRLHRGQEMLDAARLGVIVGFRRPRRQ